MRGLSRSHVSQGLLVAAAVASGVLVSSHALALNPLEYPDNGANQFSRGGAWLATATDPIAVHYNPAALATQASAVSIDLRLNYQKVCFDRRDEDGNPTGPDGGGALAPNPDGESGLQYTEACNARGDFPLTIPSLAMVWRATDKLGFGVAFVPPSAYGTANEAFPALAPLRNLSTGEEQLGPAPYRYMSLGQQSTIAFPTASVGWEVFDGFRVGAGFVSGFAVINVQTAGISSVEPTRPYDVANQDSSSHLRTEDWFMPGVVASIHWSITPTIDLALWGRYVEGVKTEQGTLDVTTQYYGPAPYRTIAPICTDMPLTNCEPGVRNSYQFKPEGGDGPMTFDFPYPPPEVRAGVRYHHPRTRAARRDELGHVVRDPLHDDLFDVELNGSYTWNSVANEIKVRFPEDDAGKGPVIEPTGANIPPIADRPTGFQDSWGLRLGGQVNLIQDKLGLMVGGWYESRSQKPELLNISPPGPERGGIGGGIVLRQDFIDVTFGYQLHVSAPLDNGGQGIVRAPAGVTSEGFSTNDEPRDLPAEDRREFRSFHTINGGRVTQSAHAFAIGTVIRF
jgi:hypothetical protein